MEDKTAWEGVSRGMALRFGIRKDWKGTISGPLLSTRDHWVSLAVRSDPQAAAREAAGNAARFLDDRYGMSSDESGMHIDSHSEQRIERRLDGTFLAGVLLPKSAIGNRIQAASKSPLAR
jgi:acetamidase/formamidase